MEEPTETSMQNTLGQLREWGEKIPTVPNAYPLQKSTFGDGIASDDLEALQSSLVTPLPEDFVLFQRLCGSVSAPDVWNGYFLFPALQITSLLADAQMRQTIQTGHETAPVIPLGGDGGGNLFLLSLNGSGRVVKSYHETGKQEELAPTFALFLERMRQDWEQFVAQNAGWNYMTG